MQVGANMKNGMVDKDSFKIVYVAPMKALAAEMTATFGKRLASLGESPSKTCPNASPHARYLGPQSAVQGICQACANCLRRSCRVLF